jgi:hypothetical protein
VSEPIDRLLDRLEGVARAGTTTMARCPAHDDRVASLSVSEGDDGRVLVHCHAGCTIERIVAAVGLELRDLYVEPPSPNGARTIVAAYDYHDEDGAPLFQVVRFVPKDFRQRHRDAAGGEWIWNLQGVRRVLYRLPQVIDAVAAGRRVFVVEGERDADRLVSAGEVATCNPMGAAKWRAEYVGALEGAAEVIVVADADTAGRAHAKRVAESLRGRVGSLRIVEAAEGKDAYDHFESGHDADNFVEVFNITAGPTFELPDGFKLWSPGDDAVPDPELGADVRQGVIGEYLDLIEGRTEATSAAVGAELLACIGTLIGRRAKYVAGDVVHHANLFIAIVGPSSEGAKGVADSCALKLVNDVAPGFLARHSISGLGSGEALVRELADRDEDPPEKSRILFDAELAGVLKVVRREGSILGPTLRKAYDYFPLRHSTITNKVTVATDHHVSVLGAITPEELRVLVDQLAIANGLGNRFLYVWSRLGTLLPHGGDIDPEARGAVADRLIQALENLDGSLLNTGCKQVPLDPPSRELWHDFYMQHRRGVGEGLVKALTGRHVAHAARISVIYAVADGAPIIRRHHLAAAIAWCAYSTVSVTKAFGYALERKADELLRAVRDAMPGGIDGTTLHQGLAHNWRAGELAAARAELERRRLVYVVSEPSAGGRPRERYLALALLVGRK